jgi:phenylalanine-4-hydroxylase
MNITQDTDWIWWYDSVSHSLWQRLPDQQWKVWEALVFDANALWRTGQCLQLQDFLQFDVVSSQVSIAPKFCTKTSTLSPPLLLHRLSLSLINSKRFTLLLTGPSSAVKCLAPWNP